MARAPAEDRLRIRTRTEKERRVAWHGMAWLGGCLDASKRVLSVCHARHVTSRHVTSRLVCVEGVLYNQNQFSLLRTRVASFTPINHSSIQHSSILHSSAPATVRSALVFVSASSFFHFHLLPSPSLRACRRSNSISCLRRAAKATVIAAAQQQHSMTKNR